MRPAESMGSPPNVVTNGRQIDLRLIGQLLSRPLLQESEDDLELDCACRLL